MHSRILVPYKGKLLAEHLFKEPYPTTQSIDLLTLAFMDLLIRFVYPRNKGFAKFTNQYNINTEFLIYRSSTHPMFIAACLAPWHTAIYSQKHISTRSVVYLNPIHLSCNSKCPTPRHFNALPTNKPYILFCLLNECLARLTRSNAYE